ncbi:PRICKLE1 [Bugula neritina]|uniref:PRICKLE1 n=1 Tax=Bugula neritina TaxID=10212 RepID=A0A7J7JYU3_BUGNE|nr:PRICKLE1 [Bugula neritina]
MLKLIDLMASIFLTKHLQQSLCYAYGEQDSDHTMDNIPLAASKKRQEHQAVNNAWSCLEPSACTECNPVETTDCRVTSMNCNGSLESHRTFQNSAVAMTKLCSDFQRQCGSTSDNDSGCALEEFAWVPPGVRIEQVYQYFSHLPDDLVPFIGSVDVEHCQQLAEDELQEHTNFNEQLKKEALGQGSIRQIPLTLDTVNCTKCEGPIEPGDVALFAARAGSNCQWHPQCFVCEECEELLVNLIYFYKDEKIYCGRHYAEKQKPRCNFCDELIFAEECTEAEGSCWHIKHFACFECKRQLGGTRYVMRDRVPYCCECFDRRLAEYCAACGKPIRVDEGQMSYGTQFWHASDTCFRCSTCDRVLLGRHFLSTNSSLYCSIECSRGITTHSDSHSIHQSPVSHSTELSPIQERLQCSDDPWIFRRSSEERFGGGVLPPPIRRSLPDLTTEDELTDVDRRPPPLPPKRE